MLVVAPNEARAGVGRGVAVVADAVEAVLGAVYLDGGLDAARPLVREAWATRWRPRPSRRSIPNPT